MGVNVKKTSRPSFKPLILDEPIKLTSEEMEAVEKQVRAELRAREKKRLLAEYHNTLMRRLTGEVDVQHEMDDETFVQYTLDLAPHADRIILDGRHYMHGQTYEFNSHQLRTVKDIEHNTWKHERSVQDANRDKYKPVHAKSTVIRPSGITHESV